MAVALKTRVTNLGGQIVATEYIETRYLIEPDALGNTHSLIDDTGAEADSYTYWPYGEQRTATVGIEFPFKFCGTWGYYTEPLGGYPLYVRARYYRQPMGRWITVDPLWPGEMAYGYVSGGPTRWSDASGLGVLADLDRCQCKGVSAEGITKLCNHSDTKEGTRRIIDCVNNCNVNPGGKVSPACVYSWCSKGKLACGDCPSTQDVDCPEGCAPQSIKFPNCAYTMCSPNMPSGQRKVKLCCNATLDALKSKCCCPSVWTGSINCEVPGEIIFHELVHVCTPDCAYDFTQAGQDKNNAWARCFIQCMGY